MNFDTQYKYNRGEEFDSARFGTINHEKSMTQQSDANDSDINVIMEKYAVTGQLPKVIQEGLYGDFTEVGDYRGAVERIRAADEAFMLVPAEIREKFNNDPAQFMEFAQKEENLERLQKMGLEIPGFPKETKPAESTPAPIVPANPETGKEAPAK